MRSKDGNRPITRSQTNVSRDTEIKCSKVKDKVKIHKKKKQISHKLADSSHLGGNSIGLVRQGKCCRTTLPTSNILLSQTIL